MKTYDYIIIGAGSGGLTVAAGLGALGKNHLLVSENIGGECTHYGCVPSKKFLQLSKDPKNSPNPFPQIKAQVKDTLEHDDKILEDYKVNYTLGRANFTSTDTIKITPNDNSKPYHVKFKKAVISTGSSARRFEIENYPNSKILDNETVFSLKQLPKDLTIIGGGPIGVEMATAFSRYGVKVTLATRDHVLSREPREFAHKVIKTLKDNGVEVIEHLGEIKVNKEDITFINNEGEVVTTDPKPEFILQAIGRKPNTNLNLEQANIEVKKSGIQVDSNFRTTNWNIFAIGDVIPLPKFTHLANNQGRFLVKKFLMPLVSYKKTALPAVTFSDPTIASVGEAIANDFTEDILLDLSTSERAIIEGDKISKAILNVNMITGKINKASLIGPSSEHLVNFFTLMINQKISIRKISNFMAPYPTHFSAITSIQGKYLNLFKTNYKKYLTGFLKYNSSRIITAIVWTFMAYVILRTLHTYNYDQARIVEELAKIFRSDMGRLLFIFIYILKSFVPFPAILLTVISGSVYGFIQGVILTVIGSNLSALTGYGLGRFVFASDSDQNNPSEVAGIRKFIAQKPMIATFIARMGGLPFDIISYIAGAMKVPPLSFISGSALGTITGTIAFVSIGTSIQNIEDYENITIDPIYTYIGIAIFIASIISSRFVTKWSEKKHGVSIEK